jgi:retron-type reverse transcriptase
MYSSVRRSVQVIKCINLTQHIAYENIQLNQRSRIVTRGVDFKNTVSSFNQDLVEKISVEIKNGTYKWKDIKRIKIPKHEKKEKKPFGILTFSDKIVQEMLRLVLLTIYEPIFQSLEYNQGFRSKRDVYTTMYLIQAKGQGMEIAMEGDIVNIYNSINCKILIKILKKKIGDKKFLKLIEEGIKHNIYFDVQITSNFVDVMEKYTLFPILFNIYMNVRQEVV